MTENTRPLRDFFQSLPQGTPTNLVGSDLTVIPLSSIGGGINSVQAGVGVSVNSADPENPVVGLSFGSQDSLALADTSLQPGGVAITDIEATGTPSDTTYLRGDGAWSTPSGGGGGGQVDTVVAGDGIDVDDTDPVNPIVGLDSGSVASLALADTAVQPSRTVTAGTGLSGGGDMSANRTISLSSTSIASLSLADTAVQPDRTISPSTGLTGGGDLSANRSIAIDKATTENVRAREPNKVLTADNISGAKGAVALAYASTRSLDWKDGWYRTCTLTGNMTLSNPTNVEEGDTIVLRLVGSDATERSLAFGSNFKGPLPEDTVSSTKGLLVSLFAATATEVHVTWKAFEL